MATRRHLLHEFNGASATPGDVVGVRGYVGGCARSPFPAGEAASPMESPARFRYHAESGDPWRKTGTNLRRYFGAEHKLCRDPDDPSGP